MTQLKIVVVMCMISVTDMMCQALDLFPSGFLSDCPNITVPIKKHDLKKLGLVVHGSGSNKRTRYNYFQAHLIPKDPRVDWSRKTLIYVGGYFDSPAFINDRIMEMAYLDLGYNVLLLDELFFVLDKYPIVSRKVRSIARHVAEMLAVIHGSGVMNTSQVEMIGISLGGHTMAFIAREFHRITGVKIGRLTGLDPAGPCFRNLGPEDRLSPTDGAFVDVIHTNTDVFGMATPMGHVDFYIQEDQFKLQDATFKSFYSPVYNHLKVYIIWMTVLTVSDVSFVGVKCDSMEQVSLKQCSNSETNVLGLNTDKGKQGIFYLEKSSFQGK